ncbi:uncharacterized protein TNCV_4672061 [Trichonephila clavipes]|nr:uncharacterized protein TNCV_4672061 [Trichonephila clavipes]
MTKRHFSDGSGFCLHHQDDLIRVWWHPAERTLATCIHHCHTVPSPDMKAWGAIGYTFRSPLVHIDDTLNSARYISSLL